MPKFRLRSFFLIIAAITLLAAPRVARAADASALLSAPMSFRLMRVGSSGFAQVIVAIGTIKSWTAVSFENFLEANRGEVSRGTKVYLISPGGNLPVGLDLGRAIRKHGYVTVVGIPVPPTGSFFTALDKPGFCASACTFAFLGGIARTVVPGSQYLVHRFFVENGDRLSIGRPNVYEENAQIQAGELVAYLNTMGIAPGFYTLMTQGGNSKKHPPVNLDQATLARLHVTTSETIAAHMLYPANQPPVLRLRDEDGGMLYGRMDLFCTPRHQLLLRAYFSPVRSQPQQLAIDLDIYSPGTPPATFSVPPNAFSVDALKADTLSVDVYIPPGEVFHALQDAGGITVKASGPGVSLLENIPASDSIGNSVALPIPVAVHSRIMAVAKSC